jgi:hypothetical protein
MTSTPQEPLDETVDSAGQDTAGGAPVSGSPAGADSDLGYSRGSEGESAEQTGDATGEATGDYLDRDSDTGGPGEERNG